MNDRGEGIKALIMLQGDGRIHERGEAITAPAF